MATGKTPVVIDTSAGTRAYQLTLQYKSDLEPRLPTGTLAALVEDLTTLGSSPVAPPKTPAAPPPPPLPEALATVVTLISAVHQAIRGAKAALEVRKLYGVTTKVATKEADAVIAGGQKIVSQAQANPTEALSLGILPADVASLTLALADLTAAEKLAKGSAAGPTASGKERHAAEARMLAAVARIAGAGALAFARNAAVRAEFEALRR